MPSTAQMQTTTFVFLATSATGCEIRRVSVLAGTPAIAIVKVQRLITEGEQLSGPVASELVHSF